ncbi:MAG: spore maturation protein A, partial [Oscillospiraceae bacterium]|nr:spore maturation protein A [Oscillospiraceae bacterium]
MVLGKLLALLFALSFLSAALTGNMAAVSTAALSGAADAVTLLLSISGALCLWSGIMELMRRSGSAETLSRLLHPILRLLFPYASRDKETLASLAANMSANLLGL